jgi:hypothetical protein
MVNDKENREAASASAAPNVLVRFHRGGDQPQRAGPPDLRLKLLAVLAHRALADALSRDCFRQGLQRAL